MADALTRIQQPLARAASRETAPLRKEAPIPDVIARRLRTGPDTDPLFPHLRAYGRGRPGVTQEREWWWVIRDHRGRVVGGAMVGDMGPGHPVSIDVAIDPRRRRQGWASALYAELGRRGIDMEAGSVQSLAHGTMSVDGYRFMLARRLKADPDAEAEILEAAGICPGCGRMDDRGRPLQ